MDGRRRAELSHARDNAGVRRKDGILEIEHELAHRLNNFTYSRERGTSQRLHLRKTNEARKSGTHVRGNNAVGLCGESE